LMPVHVASGPSCATASHVASASPVLPVHVPRDSTVQAALLAGVALPEQATLSVADVHVCEAATTASHVASAPPLPVHVPRDSLVQAALLAGVALPEQAGLW